MTVTVKYKDGHYELCEVINIKFFGGDLDDFDLIDPVTGEDKNKLVANWDEIYKEIYEKLKEENK